MPYKKYQGNYIDTIDLLGLPENFYQSNSKEELQSTIEVDLPRTCYIHLRLGTDVQAIQKRLRENHLNSKQAISYTQGDFNGGVFSTTYMLKIFQKQFAESGAEEPVLPKELSFNYLDDDNCLCGFAITYLKDDLNFGRFTVSVIKNVNETPDKRQVTIILHDSLLPENDKTVMIGGNLNLMTNALGQLGRITPNWIKNRYPGIIAGRCEVTAAIVQALNSKDIAAVITPLFDMDNEVISEAYFVGLKTRLKGGQNIDNRDELYSLIDMIAGSESTIPLKDRMDKAYQSIEPFDCLLFKPDIIEHLNNYAKSHRFQDFNAIQEKFKSTYFQRNYGKLALITSNVLMVMFGVVLLSLAVFAPHLLLGSLLTYQAYVSLALIVANAAFAVRTSRKISETESHYSIFSNQFKEVISKVSEIYPEPQNRPI